MRFSLIGAMLETAPHLPQSLVTPEAFAGLSTIAKRTPPVMSSFGFECRLRAGQGAVDLGFPVPPDEGREILASGKLARRFRRSEVWRRICALCARWIDPASPMHRWISRTHRTSRPRARSGSTRASTR